MIVYHGSYCQITAADLTFSREKLDFGKGFYVTPMQSQAERWSKRFLRMGREAVLNIYELDDAIWVSSDLRIKQFESYSEEWLDFIFACRKGETSYQQYDIVAGGVANDNIFATLDAYFAGYMSKDMALEKLKFEQPNHQICILNQNILDDYLKFKESINVR